MGIFKKIRKTDFIGGAINVLENIQSDSSLADKMVMEFTKYVMKDEDVIFVIRSFKSKYGLQGHSLSVSPMISDNKLLIENWIFKIDGKPLYKERGLDLLLSKLTTCILADVSSDVVDIVNQIKTCLI